jgi:hypothetical protein
MEAGGFDEMPVATLRDELVHSLRRLGATPWPSPDPPNTRPVGRRVVRSGPKSLVPAGRAVFGCAQAHTSPSMTAR